MTRTQYYRLHQACPKCQNAEICKTCIGQIPAGKNYWYFKDTNSASCYVCGWKGIVHNLIPLLQLTIKNA